MCMVWPCYSFVDGHFRGYHTLQVFNLDLTGFFWKRKPSWTYITKEEESLPGLNPLNGGITILVCANASGDCKIKPIDIHQLENPRIFMRNKVMKRKLPAMWQSKLKSWCTRQFLVEWVYGTFGSQVREYLEEKQLPLRCLLVMDNATDHPHDLDDVLPDGFYFIKVKFLPLIRHLFSSTWTNKPSPTSMSSIRENSPERVLELPMSCC